MTFKILYAEDRESLRSATVGVMEYMAPEGSEIVAVSTGDELVDKVREGGASLVITDNDMPPGIDGLEVIRRIREYDKKLPVYLLSANEEAIRRATDIGATGVILKWEAIPQLKKVISLHSK